jgi:hypothetical protein
LLEQDDVTQRMHRRKNRRWPVLLVALTAAASSMVWFGAEAPDLDPRVWQAIVEPEVFQPLLGDF